MRYDEGPQLGGSARGRPDLSGVGGSAGRCSDRDRVGGRGSRCRGEAELSAAHLAGRIVGIDQQRIVRGLVLIQDREPNPRRPHRGLYGILCKRLTA